MLMCQNLERCFISISCVTMVKYNQSFTVVCATSTSAGWDWFFFSKIVWFLVKVYGLGILSPALKYGEELRRMVSERAIRTLFHI